MLYSLFYKKDKRTPIVFAWIRRLGSIWCALMTFSSAIANYNEIITQIVDECKTYHTYISVD